MNKHLKIFHLSVFLLILIIATLFLYDFYNEEDRDDLMNEVMDDLERNLYVTIVESHGNRVLCFDDERWYCKKHVFKGGNNPDPYDLAYPQADIVFLFFEDIEEESMADNFSDLIVRINPVIIDEELYVVVVFFAEGAYEKQVHYKNDLLYRYTDDNPESNYGIKLIRIKE